MAQNPNQPNIHMNEFQQPVREYDWEDFQNRLKQRLPYTGKEDLNGKTLVIKHTWGIGDVLYSTPAIKAIKEKFPKVKLVYISAYPVILEGNPDVDMNCHWQQFEDFLDLGDKLKDEKWYFVTYDTPLKGGYDYKVNLRTQLKLNEHMYDLLRKDPKTLSAEEIQFVENASGTLVDRYRKIALDLYCLHLHVDPPVKSVYYYPTEEELAFAKMFLNPISGQRKKKVITLMPHTSTFFKDYPHWREVIRLCPLDYVWVILDGRARPNENWIGTNIVNCIAAFNLRQTAALIIEGDLCCSSDTGLLYTKAARGGKCVVTYGPHEPQPFLHYFPSARGLRVESVSGLRDGPCCTVGCYIDSTACRPGGGPPPCLDQLSPQQVANAIQEQLETK
jgi:ADP-heptose:LPS heptosyltransferase